MENYLTIKRKSRTFLGTHVTSNDPFFLLKDRVSVNILPNKIVFKRMTIDSLETSYSIHWEHNSQTIRKFGVSTLMDYLGKYSIDPEEVTEDELIIYLEDKID